MRRRGFGFQQEEFCMHEESWNFESEEHYSHGSSMQMMTRPCPPKHSKHQTMFNNGSNTLHHQDMLHGHQNGWLGSYGINNKYNHASGGRKKPVYGMNETQFLENGMFRNASTDMPHGQNMHQNGSNGTNGQLNSASGFNKKPVSCMNETQFLENNGMFDNASMDAEFRNEYSTWGGNDAAGHCQSFENNFNWRLNGCTDF